MSAAAGIAIRPVTEAEDARAVAALVAAFFDLLRTRYPELSAEIDAYHAQQDVAGEMERLAARGVPAGGACLLATLDGIPVGTVMLKRLASDLCEMNRMFVTEAGRGHGLGRALALRLIAEARALGYAAMRLDALERHVEALPLYRSLGFGPDPDPPEATRHVPGIVSMRLAL